MDIHGVVKKLVGSIRPIGETNADNIRFENLKVMTELVDSLLFDISYVAKEKDQPEFSVQRAGKYADKFFKELESTMGE